MESTANVSQKTLKRLAQYMLKTRMNQHTVTTQKETIQPVKIWVDFTSNNHLTFLWFSYKNLGWFMLNQAVKIAQSLGHPLDPEIPRQKRPRSRQTSEVSAIDENTGDNHGEGPSNINGAGIDNLSDVGGWGKVESTGDDGECTHA